MFTLVPFFASNLQSFIVMQGLVSAIVACGSTSSLQLLNVCPCSDPSDVGQDTTCGNAKIAAELIKIFIVCSRHINSGGEEFDKFSTGTPSLLDMVSCPCSDSSDAANSCLHARDSFVHRCQVGCSQPGRQLLVVVVVVSCNGLFG